MVQSERMTSERDRVFCVEDQDMGSFVLYKTLSGSVVLRLPSRRQEGKYEAMQGWLKATVAEM